MCSIWARAVEKGRSKTLHMATVVVDRREAKLARLLQDAEVRSLDVGDIMCTYDQGGVWIAERKTCDDLANSMRDGRFAEQKDLPTRHTQIRFVVVGGDTSPNHVR